MGQEALAATEKRAWRQNALIIFEDESGVSLLPSVRATWAPRGHTPVSSSKVHLHAFVANFIAEEDIVGVLPPTDVEEP